MIKKFIANCVLLLLIVFLLDRGFGSLLGYYFHKQKSGNAAKTLYALTDIKEDIVVFGSSRAAHHYVSPQLEKATGLSCFNTGRDGMKMEYYKLLLEAILKYHKPKIVLLDLNYNDLTVEGRNTDVFISALLPVMDYNVTVKEYVFREAPLEGWKARLSLLYKYNSRPASIMQNIRTRNDQLDGYDPLHGSKVKDGVQVISNTKNYHEDGELIREFESFVRLAKENGIRLYVIYSPSLMKIKYDYTSTARRICSKYGVPLLNYSSFFRSSDNEYFYDRTHMNDDGAERFTRELSEDLFNQGKHEKKLRNAAKPQAVVYQTRRNISDQRYQ